MNQPERNCTKKKTLKSLDTPYKMEKNERITIRTSYHCDCETETISGHILFVLAHHSYPLSHSVRRGDETIG